MKTILNRRIRMCFLIILFGLLSLQLSAQTIKSSLNHTELTTTSPVINLDNFVRPLIYGWSCNEEVKDAKLTITLSMNNLKEEFGYGGNPFNASVEVAITAMSPFFTPVFSDTKSLAINDLRPEQTYLYDYSDPAMYSGISYFVINITSYKYDSYDFVTDNIKLSAEVNVDFKLKAHHITSYTTKLVSSPKTSQSAGDTKIALNWNNTCAFPAYQVQVLRLYNNILLSGTSSSEQKITAYVDWNKAVTFETNDSEFEYTPTQGQGWYTWRVRPIGDYYDGGIADSRNWGEWKGFVQGVSKTFTSSSSAPAWCIFYQDINSDYVYSLTKAFSGDNKIREGIDFFNGMLMQEQSQIKLQSQDTLVVNDYYYDFSGRNSLYQLSEPLSGTVMTYLSTITLDESGGVYTAEDFDADDNYRAPSTMESTYWSDLNADKSIPSSEGYPFNRNLFWNDGSGRVKETNMPGEAHTIGNNTVLSYYSTPTSQELNYIFGTEAPYYKSLTKLITINPDNVATVQYLDKQGKVIAQFLTAGSGPDELEYLPSRETQTLEVEITDNLPYGEFGIYSDYEFSLTQTTTVYAEYSLNVNEIESCTEYCTTCDYLVTLRLIDLNTEREEEEKMDVSYEFVVEPEVCDGMVTAYLFDGAEIKSLTFENLPIGMYKIEKKIMAYNIDENSKTADNPFGNTYIYNHLYGEAGIQALAESQLTTQLEDVYTYLEDETYTHQDLYDYLDAESSVEKNYDAFGVTASYSISGACCDINIPIKECFEYTCPNPIDDASQYEQFELYLMNEYVKQYEEYNVRYGPRADMGAIAIYITSYLADPSSYSGPDPVDAITGYTMGKINNLLFNMLNDPEVSAEIDISKYYSCEMIWECWDASVQSALSNLVALADGDIDDYDMVDNFLNCTGKHYKGFTRKDYASSLSLITPKFNASKSVASGGYKSHAYALFQYASGSASDCESQYRAYWGGYWPAGQDAEIDESCFDETTSSIICDPYSNKRWEQFYLCAKNGNTEATQGPDYYEKVAEDGCENACESREDAFIMEAEALLEESGIAYGDADVDCIVQMLMDKCKSECDVTVFYDGAITIGTTHIASGGIISGQLYKVVADASCPNKVINYNGKSYGTDSEYGDQFYGNTGYTNYGVVTSGVMPGTNIFVYEDNTQYLGIGTDAEILNVKEAMTYSFEIDFTDADGNCQEDEELLPGTNTASASINMLNNSELTSTSSSTFPCSFNASFWNKSHGNPLTVKDDEANQTPLSVLLKSYTISTIAGIDLILGDGISYEPRLNLTNGVDYTLEYDIKLDEQSPASSLDNFYVVLAQSIPSIDPMAGKPIIAGAPAGGQTISYRTNVHNPTWRTITTHFTLDIPYGYPTNSLVLWLYNLQNSENDTAIIRVDNIKLSPTVYETCYDLCFKWMPFEITAEPTVYEIPTCDDNIKEYLLENIQAQLTNCINNTVDDFETEYMSTCADPDNIDDLLTISYDQGNFHYTLFYYDLAGRLVKTVPPKGVDLSNTTYSATVKPDHTLLSSYQHNSLGQMIRKESPDGGEANYWYNGLGQIRFAQNAQQLIDGEFGYTLYNKLGQAIEGGIGDISTMTSGTELDDYVNDITWPSTGTSERNFIIYNAAYEDPSTSSEIEYYGGKKQRYLHNRISYTYNDDQAYIIYSYDPLGNVEWMIHEIPGLGKMYVAYEYDPFTGLSTKMKYNEEALDKFFTRFAYDDDKRLKTVETSLDGYIWDKDASYTYFAHGPLKRIVIGNDKLQGNDFTYTIEGWLKGINHPDLSASSDPGSDGSGSSTIPVDVFGMELNYYDGDFSHTGSVFNNTHSSHFTASHNLYSGMISSIASNIAYQEGSLQYEYLTGEQYTYDELYRLKQSDFYGKPDSATAWTSTTDYQTQTSYDANGNITSMNRSAYDAGWGLNMDELTYNYTADGDGDGIEDDNRLQYISDAIATSDFDDLDDQTSTTNYTYDAIGRLLADDAEGITIEWNALHKPQKVQTADGYIEYLYNPKGDRISKIYTNTTESSVTTTYYVRDTKGQVIAKYKDDGLGLSSSLTTDEFVIYGGNQLGVWDTTIEVPAPGVSLGTTTATTAIYTRNLGQKVYQITDHLGNVRTIFSDKKLGVDDGSGNYTYATDSIGYSNYYAYGMLMPGRSMDIGNNYMYGYQGKEKDNELKGNNNSYDFGARILDPRVGRWLSTDPLDAKFPSMSPYNAMGNNPINLIDPDGRDIYYYRFRMEDEKPILINVELIEGDDQYVVYAEEYFHVPIAGYRGRGYGEGISHRRVLQSYEKTFSSLEEVKSLTRRDVGVPGKGWRNTSTIPWYVISALENVKDAGSDDRLGGGNTVTDFVEDIVSIIDIDNDQSSISDFEDEENNNYGECLDPVPDIPPTLKVKVKTKKRIPTKPMGEIPDIREIDGGKPFIEDTYPLRLKIVREPGSVNYDVLRGDHTNYDRSLDDYE